MVSIQLEGKLDEYRKALQDRANLVDANDALKKQLEDALERLKKSEDEKLILQKKVALGVTWGDQKQGLVIPFRLYVCLLNSLLSIR